MREFYDLNDTVVREVYRARTALLYVKPLLAEVALQMDVVILDESTWCPRAATDGMTIYFNRDFVISLFFDAGDRRTKTNGHNRLVAIMAHEIYHVIFGHLLRRGNREEKYWAMAIDFIVNAAIKEEKIGLLPSMALLDSRFTTDMTAEEVYDYIVKNKMPLQESLDVHREANEMGDAGNKGMDSSIEAVAVAARSEANTGGITTSKGDVEPDAISMQEANKFFNQARMAVIQAIHEGDESAGLVPASLRREISDLIDSRMDWKKIINTSLRSIQPFEYTYDELSDVTWASWIYHKHRWHKDCGFPKGYCAILPSQSEGTRVEATIAIDTSASVTSAMIRDFLSEIGGMMESFNEVEIRVLCFDAEVGSEQIFTETSLHKLKDFKKTKVKGGGGTRFTCVWEYLEKNKIVPDRLILCTDGIPGDGKWGYPSYCETIFLIHDKSKRKKAPFGTTTYID